MINILLPVYTIRHEYTFRIIFDLLLGVEYKYTIAGTKEDISAALNDHEAFIGYGTVADDRILTMYESEMLNEKIIASQLKGIDDKGEFIKYFYFPDNTLIDFDIFSAVFHLITEYDRYDIPAIDEHGRYKEYHYEPFAKGHFKFPLVNIYTEYLWKRLVEKFPFLPPRTEKKFTWEITIDVDEPWAYLNKGIYGRLGFLKDRLLGNKENLALRKSAFLTKKDPYYSFDELFALLPPENTIFFFLLNGKSNFDSHFTSCNRNYRKLIKKIDYLGYKTALHPSYFSYLETDIIEKQKKSLEKILKKQVTTSRQHFMKYLLPETYECLEEAGISDDYTSSLIHDTGFRNFIACPFPFYNLDTNTISKVTIHPTMAMDVTLFKYLGLTPENAIENIRYLIDSTAEYNGKFVLIWHNSNYTEFNNLGPWKKVLQETLAYLKEKTNVQD